jgi:Flp pilus assembly CpaE family ATPase
MVKNPVVFVDVSGAVPEVQKMVLARAHKIVLVSNATVSCLRLARSLAQEIKDVRGGNADDIALTINMSGFAASHEMPKGDIQTAMEMPIAAIVPYEPKLFVQMESEGAPCFKEKNFKDIQKNIFIPFIEKALGFTRSDKTSTANDDGRTIFSGLLGKLAKR